MTDITVKRLRHGVIAGLCGAVVAVCLWSAGMFDAFEAKTYDWRVRLLARPGAATDTIRLILLDQNSLDWASAENGLSWPWPREVYAAVVDFCARAGAKSLTFDVLYTEPSKYGVADDQALGRAGTAFGRLVLPVFLGRETGREESWPGSAPDFPFKPAGLASWLDRAPGAGLDYPRAAFPVPEIAAGAKLCGNVHLDPDFDGVYRRAGLFSLFDGRVVPFLPLAAYLASEPTVKAAIAPGAFVLGPVTVPIDASARAAINYRGPSGTYAAVSAASVIQSELRLREGKKPTVDPEFFRDKHVFFGFTAPGLFDLRPAPVGGVFTGVEIQATVLDNLLSGDFLRDAPYWLAAACMAFFSLAAGVSVSLAGRALAATGVALVCLPLPALASVAAQAGGAVLPLVPGEAGAAVAMSVSVLIAYATEGRQKRFIKSAFRQYLSPQVIEQLIRDPGKMRLGGEKRVLTIFFSDLQGFTTISEGLSPEALTALLNEYLSAMTDIILESGGTVDKYEGDAIIAFWNAPVDQSDHAARCLAATLKCQERLAAMRPDFAGRIGKELLMRVGVNTGPAVVGNMGSKKRFDYTMLGDAVNLAARLEGVNKQFGTYTMISRDTLEASGGLFPARELARVAVVGRKEPVTVYEPMVVEEYARRKPVLDTFGQGLALFYEGQFADALAVFESIKDADPPAAHYLAKCRELMESPPEGEWSGVWVMTQK
jgi:adenylate cyclase